MGRKYDFSGWATKNDLLCADGRVIKKDAFAHNDGETVPLVWNHQHGGPANVLGHALLENREEGVYAYCSFNNSPSGKSAKEAVVHGDVKSLSIYANNLKHNGSNVIHGAIREVSLVLAGANPGARIEDVITHGIDEEAAEIYMDEAIELFHAEEDKSKDEEKKPETKEEKPVAENNDKTVKDVIDSMTEEQKTVLYALVGEALEGKGGKNTEDEGDDDMKHNMFDVDYEQEQSDVLAHDALNTIIKDAKRHGSLKESFLAHSQEYGIENIEYLFPDAKTLQAQPEFIKRDMDWVNVVMNSTHHTPFSRIKSIFADITADEARAKGYLKGHLKKEEVFSLLKRTTTPTTIYKKQKLDRDDTIDITDFDVIAWLKTEMRMMLNEELARAILIGDGRLASDDDKINESNIRPIVSDAALYTIQYEITYTDAKDIINASIKSRKSYKGSGKPTFFTTEDVVTDMLLLEDGIGHKLYKNEEELATALRVKQIVTVPVMEGLKDKDGKEIFGIIVNLVDYNVGADKGGAVNMFDDFDIDYNQMKYLIETRCSGALVKPYSAIVLKKDAA